MNRLLSFRVFRNIGFLIPIVLILVVSLFSFFILKRIDRKIEIVTEKVRPSLSAVLKMQIEFVHLYPHLQKYVAGQSDVYQEISWRLDNLEHRVKAAKIDLPPEEAMLFYNFAQSFQHLKISIKSFHDELLSGPASPNTAELNNIISQKMREANSFLNIIVTKIISKIQLLDNKMLQQIQKDRLMLTIYLLLSVFIGFAIMVLINRALAAHVNTLMEGAEKIGQGDLEWRIPTGADDEFGLLAKTFNTMSENLKHSKQELVQRADDLQKTLTKLKQTQEDLSRAERLALVGETSGRVAHEVLNPITSIFSRVENNIDQWQEFNNVLEGTQEIVKDWQSEYRSGDFAGYLTRQSDNGKSYGDEDFELLNNLTDSAVTFQQQRINDLKFIYKQLQRVIKIINNLRESVRAQKTITKFKIAKTIEEALEVMEDSLKKRNIEVKRTIPPDLPHIMADESEVIQVFTNMFRNAIQSIEEKRLQGGMISTVASFTNGKIAIRIKDTGNGIPQKAQGSIFDFNFSTKERDKGTGLGLGISRRFVRETGGDLVLEESVKGVGSTFLITIPPAQEHDEGR